MGGQDRGVSGSKGVNEKEGSTRGTLVNLSYSLGSLLYVIHTCNLLMQERFAESCVPDGAYTIQ